MCRNKEELKKVKSTTTITTVEKAHVLRDQLYPVKVNNARADTLLIPDRTFKANAALEMAAENQNKLAKIAWLSKMQNGKAYKSLVTYFTKGSEAQRFLHKGYMYVGRESANVSRFKPSEDPPHYYNY